MKKLRIKLHFIDRKGFTRQVDIFDYEPPHEYFFLEHKPFKACFVDCVDVPQKNDDVGRIKFILSHGRKTNENEAVACYYQE